jgi:hypothetical protein
MRLRNHLIAHLEEANSECCKEKESLLTFAVRRGGFAGVETLAEINDFVRGSAALVFPTNGRQSASHPYPLGTDFASRFSWNSAAVMFELRWA